MAKQTQHYPSQYFKIADKTIRLERWEMEMPTIPNANSLRTTWYHFVAALKKEGNIEDWIAAVRVKVTTKGNIVVFEDRNKTAVAQALADEFKDEPASQLDLDTQAMMEEYAKRKKEGEK